MSSFVKKIMPVAVLASVALSSVAYATDHGTEAEAQEMVKKAVALVKSAGPEKAYKAFTEHPDATFNHKDLYVFVYDFEGNCLAQGANAKMVGKNLLSMKDVDGNALSKA